MHRVGFSATTSIDRDDFGVSFNARHWRPAASWSAKKVDIDLEVEATLRA